MQSLFVVMLLAIACSFCPCTAQNHSGSAQRTARNQLAYNLPDQNQSAVSQQNSYNPYYNSYNNSNNNNNPYYNSASLGGNTQPTSSAWSDPAAQLPSQQLPSQQLPSEQLQSAQPGTWTPAQNGVANAYNFSDLSAGQTSSSSVGRGLAPSYGSYAMTDAEILAARRAILSGSFFSYHGTQSSRNSRNR